jgi:nicotinamidase/pyrazinamidase
VLVIDMVNDFVLPGAPLEVPSARRIIPAIKKRIEDARRRGVTVIYVCDAHAEDDAEFEIWGRHAVEGTEGAEVVAELTPAPGDIVLAKTGYSAFYKTQLENVLKQHDIKKLTLVGILTDICVLFTAADAVMRGFEVEIPRDSIATMSDEENEYALRLMARVLKTRIT